DGRAEHDQGNQDADGFHAENLPGAIQYGQFFRCEGGFRGHDYPKRLWFYVIAIWSSRSCVTELVSTRPFILPSCITTIRSETSRISCSSDEMKMMESPLLVRSVRSA